MKFSEWVTSYTNTVMYPWILELMDETEIEHNVEYYWNVLGR